MLSLRWRASSPDPNSSKITKSMPSAYTVKGTGRCWKRKLPRSLLASVATAFSARNACGFDFASAAASRLVFSGLRKIPVDCSACESRFSGRLISGADCRTRSLRRTMALSLRTSSHFAYVDGRVRDRQTSPSNLSNLRSIADIPRNPASSASVSMSSIRRSSAGVGVTSASVARSRPIVAVRMSECPMNEHTFGPSGLASSVSMYSSPLVHVLWVFIALRTCSRGMASTRPNRSPASDAVT